MQPPHTSAICVHCVSCPFHTPCRYPIPNPLPENLGPNLYGYISLFTLPTSLIASTMLNEAFWQRVWASASPRTLHIGACVGFVAIVLLVFLSGFGGWLAFAAGLATLEDTNPNVYLMQVRALRICQARCACQRICCLEGVLCMHVNVHASFCVRARQIALRCLVPCMK